ncbi:MAG TPA: type II toxin-antitoxin system RelE/ParE family toxin [Chloroflexota bacterium]|nr:type II toxin-antitoxin system RelE/ParE family toxin [Chloroflexota bacterium]
MDVVWKARALKDREQIHAYLARTSLMHAHRTIAAIQRAINHLEQHPQLGRQVPDRPGERLLVVPRTYYMVAYRVIARGPHPRLEIMRIVDQRRAPKK